MRRHLVLISLLIATASAANCPQYDLGPNISGVPQIGISAVRVTPNVDTIFATDSTGAAEHTQFTATAFSRTDAAIPSLRFVWESSNGSVASVDSVGNVTAVAPGTTVISASAGKIGHATLVVLPAP